MLVLWWQWDVSSCSSGPGKRQLCGCCSTSWAGMYRGGPLDHNMDGKCPFWQEGQQDDRDPGAWKAGFCRAGVQLMLQSLWWRQDVCSIAITASSFVPHCLGSWVCGPGRVVGVWQVLCARTDLPGHSVQAPPQGAGCLHCPSRPLTGAVLCMHAGGVSTFWLAVAPTALSAAACCCAYGWSAMPVAAAAHDSKAAQHGLRQLRVRPS